MTHDLKTWPEPFAAIAMGEKHHEIRRADRPFSVGDTLRLREWDPATQRYSGHTVLRTITYLTRGGEWGLPANLCVMSLGPFIAPPASEHGGGDAGQAPGRKP